MPETASNHELEALPGTETISYRLHHIEQLIPLMDVCSPLLIDPSTQQLRTIPPEKQLEVRQQLWKIIREKAAAFSREQYIIQAKVNDGLKYMSLFRDSVENLNPAWQNYLRHALYTFCQNLLTVETFNASLSVETTLGHQVVNLLRTDAISDKVRRAGIQNELAKLQGILEPSDIEELKEVIESFMDNEGLRLLFAFGISLIKDTDYDTKTTAINLLKKATGNEWITVIGEHLEDLRAYYHDFLGNNPTKERMKHRSHQFFLANYAFFLRAITNPDGVVVFNDQLDLICQSIQGDDEAEGQGTHCHFKAESNDNNKDAYWQRSLSSLSAAKTAENNGVAFRYKDLLTSKTVQKLVSLLQARN